MWVRAEVPDGPPETDKVDLCNGLLGGIGENVEHTKRLRRVEMAYEKKLKAEKAYATTIRRLFKVGQRVLIPCGTGEMRVVLEFIGEDGDLIVKHWVTGTTFRRHASSVTGTW